jgi:ribosomal protein S18 acetylase RimI-like enzyme
VPDDARRAAADAAVVTERQFVLALGGFALEIAGAVLVTHEKLPSPRFNFVDVRGIAPERQSAFFERSLDHYFQRAIRPTFRLRPPVPPHLDAGLRRLGLRPRPAPLELMIASEEVPDPDPTAVRVRSADRGDLDTVAAFWTHERERPEFRAALEVAWSHPNPGERLRPILAGEGADVVAGALVYEYGGTSGIYAVATQPGARGRGAASSLVRYARSSPFADPGTRASIFADSARLRARLEHLGFRTGLTLQEYELPTDAALAIPPPGPEGPPRWRPPRR